MKGGETFNIAKIISKESNKTGLYKKNAFEQFLSFTAGVSKLRPGGKMRPADHFESALIKFKKYNGIWPTNETCAYLILYFLNINVKIYYKVLFTC